MKKILITVSAILLGVCFAQLLASCASEHHQITGWQPTQTGCTNHSVLESLLWWHSAPLSPASFRLAIQPDTGQGPTILLVLDSGISGLGGLREKAPAFIGAVGGYKRTCVVRLSFDKCPEAKAVYNKLRRDSIPLGFNMDNPAGLTVLHAPTYYLDYEDGQGNDNQWRFYGTGHPLQRVIKDSVKALNSCWAPAWKAYNARGQLGADHVFK